MKGITLAFLGMILALLLLEAGLRLGGFIFTWVQEYGNLQSIKQTGSYRILCLGESTTQRAYPKPLERLLNQRQVGVHFSVIDKGKTATNSSFILSRIESYLDEFRPNMVIAMMGINDKFIKYYEDIPESDTWLFRHCRVFKFGAMLYRHFFKTTGTAGRGGDVEKPALKFHGADRSLKDVGTMNAAPSMRTEMKSAPDVEESPPAKQRGSAPDDILVSSGLQYRAQGKLIEAETSFKKAIEINSQNDEAYLELGHLYRLQDKLSRAEDSLRKAIELNPRNDQAYAALGWVNADQDKYAPAIDLFTKAIALNPQNADAQTAMGENYRRLRKFPQAEDCFKQAIEIRPRNVVRFLELVAFYREQEKFTEAQKVLNKAMDYFPENELLLGAQASLYEEMGKPELARAVDQRRGETGSACYAVTVHNYRKLKEILDKKGIQLVCMQYPMRNVEPLKKIFGKNEGVIFVDNESLFKEAVKSEGYKSYFRDMFAGDFGHCTPKGKELQAQHIADVILKEVFHKG